MVGGSDRARDHATKRSSARLELHAKRRLKKAKRGGITLDDQAARVIPIATHIARLTACPRSSISSASPMFGGRVRLSST
jgi:hypothetical protein